MQLFISWSEELSRLIALALRDWIPLVIQQVEPWMSEEEIKSGTRWGEEIARSLDQTDFGVICVTRSNQHNPWLMFEAGAIAKRLNLARVVPICIDLAPQDITGPLASYQAVRINRRGISRLMEDINDICEKPMSRERLRAVFEPQWPHLESMIDEAMRAGEGALQVGTIAESARSEKEMLGELIVLVRQLGNEMTAEVIDRIRELESTTNRALEPEAVSTRRLWRRDDGEPIRHLPPPPSGGRDPEPYGDWP
jgi:TIR domain